MSRLIDADKLKKVLEKNFGHTGGASVLAQLIDAQPTVEPKKGKWIDGYCSECGEHAPYWAMASAYHTTDFCPSCGSDMRG